MTSRVQGFRERWSGRYRRFAARRFARRLYRLRNERPLISFTFDDFPISAFTNGGRILNQYGLTGTFYACLGLIGQDFPAGRLFSAGDLTELVAAGQELGCHTFSHCHAWDTPARVFEESLIANQRHLGELLPGETFRTMSYPISCPRPQSKRLAARHFACCRGGGQGFNAGMTDLNYLNAFFLEQSLDGLREVEKLIDQNVKAAGWLIFATHDISENPSRFGCTTTLFEAVVRCARGSGATILPVGQALQLMQGQERDSSERFQGSPGGAAR